MTTNKTTIKAVLRAKDGATDGDKQRKAIRTELEAEARGLVMAAKMHGFMVNLMNGTATIVDTRSAA